MSNRQLSTRGVAGLASAIAILALAIASLMAAPSAYAVPECDEDSTALVCDADQEPFPPPPPPPTSTTISSISPGFGWSGDRITLTGFGFTGATVSIDNLPASISSQTSTQLLVTVPTIMNATFGPVQVPVVVSSTTGTASTSFTLSPTLQASQSATFGVNAEFGQGMDGTAWATATLDRSSGITLSELTVRNTQSLSSLTVNMSTVWLDSNGTVIGFTDPRAVTASGAFWSLSSDTTATGSFTQVVRPSPGVAPNARSARIVLVRNQEAELFSTLETAARTGMSIGSLLTTLAGFFA